MIPEFVQRHAEQLITEFCRQRLAGVGAHDLRLERVWNGDSIQLRGRQGDAVCWPIARFLYVAQLGQWCLFAPAHAGMWRPYLDSSPSLDLARLVRHLDADPFGLFWPAEFALKA